MVQLLSALAQHGTTVIITLHQPRSAMLSFIDKFHVLSEGRDVFSGSMNDLHMFFEHHVRMPIPQSCNPLDFVLDVVNSNPQIGQIIEGAQFAELFVGQNRNLMPKNIEQKMSDVAPLMEGVKNRTEIAERLESLFLSSGFYEKAHASLVPGSGQLPDKSSKAPGLARFGALLIREFLQKIRNPDIALTELAFGEAIYLWFDCLLLFLMSFSVFRHFGGSHFWDHLLALQPAKCL
jgi:hypothetical protein